jgi:hypothetical protein
MFAAFSFNIGQFVENLSKLKSGLKEHPFYLLYQTGIAFLYRMRLCVSLFYALHIKLLIYFVSSQGFPSL